MNKLTTTLSMSLFLVACGGSGSNGDSTDSYTGTFSQSPFLGAALPEPTDTETLEVNQSFTFATARTIDVDFDIDSARDTEANVSICTDYTTVGDTFDVNFDSCAINGSLDNGSFSHSVDITNDKKSVVGVVLFQDAAIAPLYKEFTVDSNQRLKRDGSSQRVIVWR